MADKELSVTLSGTYSGPGATPDSEPLPDPNDVDPDSMTVGKAGDTADGFEKSPYKLTALMAEDGTGEGLSDGTGEDGAESTVGTPGSLDGDGNPIEGTETTTPDSIKPNETIDAGGKGPMCVN